MSNLNDGIYGMVPRELMCNSAKKLRDVYEIKPNAPIFQREFGFYSFDRWIREGFIDGEHDAWKYDVYIRNLFGFDESGNYELHELGWCEAAFSPEFEEKLIEDRGEHEVVQDTAGRHVLFFKNRRTGFMPDYIDHPVKDMASWEENCKWRLNPETSARYKNLDKTMKEAVANAKIGKIITQRVIGGYMYLRSLIGPEPLFYLFYDDPDLLHACMETWLNLTDAVIAKHQQYVTLDELYLAEDICYNCGPLISPDMMREFLFPYYQQLIKNIKSRQLDKNRHLYINIDTDGNSNPVIPVYKEIGMDILNPFEVASGCDVVKIGKEHPDIAMFGGVDKRILATTKEEIDRHLDYIMPTMKKRGGYIPTCDHGVPEEVSFENYMYFRKRLLEYSK